MRLNSGSLPMLSPHAVFTEMPDSILVDTPDAELRYSGLSARRVLTIARDLDGATDVMKLALGHGNDVDALIGLLNPMADAGGVVDLSGVLNPGTVEDQLAAYYEICDLWAKDIFIRPFWTIMLSGEAPPSLVLGWCKEFYHRTAGADIHNARAVDHCADPEIREWLGSKPNSLVAESV